MGCLVLSVDVVVFLPSSLSSITGGALLSSGIAEKRSPVYIHTSLRVCVCDVRPRCPSPGVSRDSRGPGDEGDCVSQNLQTETSKRYSFSPPDHVSFM